MPYDVFISYATVDKLMADAVCGTLEARAIRCWIAPRDIVPGQDWSDAIIDGLSSARVFVLLLSAASNMSEQVKREVQNAVSEGMAIVPLRLEEIPLSKHMRYFIGTPHWLDALAPPMESHLERLAQTVHALLKASCSDEVDDVLGFGSDPAAPPESGSTAQPESPLVEWDPNELRKIERELAAFIGPMARVLVHRTAGQVSQPEELCNRVGSYITDDGEKQKFLEAARGLFPTMRAPAAPASAASVMREWDPNVLVRVERNLAQTIGPLARVLVQRASKKATDETELYALLAEHLTTPAEKDAFLKTRSLN